MPRGAVRNPAYAGTVGSQMVVEPTIKRLLHLAYSKRRSISKAFEAALAALKAVVEEEMSRPDSQWERLEPQRRIVRAGGCRPPVAVTKNPFQSMMVMMMVMP